MSPSSIGSAFDRHFRVIDTRQHQFGIIMRQFRQQLSQGNLPTLDNAILRIQSLW